MFHICSHCFPRLFLSKFGDDLYFLSREIRRTRLIISVNAFGAGIAVIGVGVESPVACFTVGGDGLVLSLFTVGCDGLVVR